MLTKYIKNQPGIRYPYSLFILTSILLLLVIACGGTVPTPVAVQPPEITEPQVGTSTPLKPGEEVGISIGVSAAGGVTLTYTWKADDGEILRGQGSPAITYRAPDKPGVYNVRVEVKWEGQSVEKATSIKVEAEPTLTSIPAPPTDTPTATTTPAPTDTPTPPETSTPTPTTPTETPTPETPPPPPCPLTSTRPPLGGPPVTIEVTITFPKHCAMGLAKSGSVGGTYSGDLTGKEIWVLVYPTDSKYYPQSPNACKRLPADAEGGVWNTPVGFGGPPQQYDVVVVVTNTDGTASQEFKRWLQRGCETSDYPGYPRSGLPDGITEVAAITVLTEASGTATSQVINTPTPPVCDDDGSKYAFCSDSMGWQAQTRVKNIQAVTAVDHSLAKAQSGRASLELNVDLVGGNDPTHSKGEAFVDLRSNPPTGMNQSAFYDLTGQTITCWVYAPRGSGGASNSHNGFQIFVKDIGFKSEYSAWHDILKEDAWFPITLTLGTQQSAGEYIDAGFDPTSITVLGVMIGAGGQSTSEVRYSGPVYVDACDW